MSSPITIRCLQLGSGYFRCAASVDLVVPHQANLRIIEAVASKAGLPAERVYINIQRYSNMPAATAPVALVETNLALSPCERSALELVQRIRAARR